MAKRGNSLPNPTGRQFWEDSTNNAMSYIQYYNRLTELAITVFKWSGLPETVDARYLELALYTDGRAVFFKDEVMGFLGMRVAAGGPLDIYNVPKMRRAYAANGYNITLDDENSVLIFNNFLHTNSMLDTKIFAKRLYDLDRAIDVNTNAQKTPLLLKCDENQRLTLINMYAKYEGNSPVIVADKQLNPESFGVLRTDAPYVADKLYTLKTQIWNEALTYFGITNVSFVKKERMISDEVQRSQGGTIANRTARLEMRKQACAKINAMFGLNVDVEYHPDFDEKYLTTLIAANDGTQDEEGGQQHE